MPFCDGSHTPVGVRPVALRLPEDCSLPVCQCGRFCPDETAESEAVQDSASQSNSA